MAARREFGDYGRAYIWTTAAAVLEEKGKSTVATGLLERFLDGGFQFCVIDPEGDYAQLENTVSLGDAKDEPRLEEAVELLACRGRQRRASAPLGSATSAPADQPEQSANARFPRYRAGPRNRQHKLPKNDREAARLFKLAADQGPCASAGVMSALAGLPHPPPQPPTLVASGQQSAQ